MLNKSAWLSRLRHVTSRTASSRAGYVFICSSIALARDCLPRDSYAKKCRPSLDVERRRARALPLVERSDLLDLRVFGPESTDGNERPQAIITVRRDGATEVCVANDTFVTLADLRRAQDHYPLINAECGTDNCTWVSVAALLANGDRMTKGLLCARIKEENTTVSKGPTSRTSLLKAAPAPREIDVISIDSNYTELSVNDVPHRKSFAVGVLMPGGIESLAHRIVGSYDGDWYRFTGWQEAFTWQESSLYR